MAEDGKQTIAVRSGHTTKLITYFQEHAKPGVVFTDEQLADLIGMSVRPKSPGYRYLYSARRYMERHHQVFMAREFRTGMIRVLDDKGRVIHADGHRACANRRLKRGSRTIATIDRTALTAAECKHADAVALMLALATSASDSATGKRIEATGVANNRTIDATDAIRRALESK